MYDNDLILLLLDDDLFWVDEYLTACAEAETLKRERATEDAE